MSTDARPQMFKIREVSKFLRVSETTVWRLVNRGELEAFKIGGAIRVSQGCINRYLGTRRYAEVRRREGPRRSLQRTGAVGRRR